MDQNDNPRKVFVVKKTGDEQEYAWTITLKSPLLRDALKHLPKAPVWLKITRVGEGKKDTRYSVEAE